MDNVQVCWITGGTILRQRAVDNILSQLGEHTVYRFNEEDSAEFVYSKINSVDIFSMLDSESTDVYVLKHIPAFDGSTKSSNKKLSDMISNLQANQFVIVDGVDPKYNKVLSKAVKEVGNFVELANTLTTKEAVTFLGLEFSKIGKVADNTDLKFLVDYIGAGDSKKFSSDYLCNIVHKFNYYLGKRKELDRKDIAMICSVDRKSTVWDLMEKLDKKDFNLALSSFENMANLKRDYRSAVEAIMYPMLWKYRILMYIKELENQGFGYKDILDRTALLVKNNEDKTRIYSEGFVRRVVQGFYGTPPTINLYSRHSLYKIYKAITFHMTNMRFYTESELRLMVTILFLVICDEIDFGCLKDVNELFSCNKVCGRL